MKTKYITIIKDGAGVGRIRITPENTMFIGTMGGLQANKSDLNFIFALLTIFDLGKDFSGSTIPHIYFKDYGNNDYLVPTNTEQKELGLFFSQIDHLIALHQRKSDALINIKKALLDKMFPSNGADVPEIRFKGFTEPWEQRKLGDLGVFSSNGVDKLINSNDIAVNLLNYMDVYNRRKITSINCNELMHVTAKPLQAKNNNILKGDVYFTPTSETAEDIGHVLVINENLPNTVYSYHLMRYRPNANAFYLTFPNFGFDTQFVHKQMTLKAKGVQRFVISKPDFESLEIKYPSYHEQFKISVMLGNLDHLITLHQRYKRRKNV